MHFMDRHKNTLIIITFYYLKIKNCKKMVSSYSQKYSNTIIIYLNKI